VIVTHDTSTATSGLPEHERGGPGASRPRPSRREQLVGLGLLRLVGAVLTLTAVAALAVPRDPNITYSRPLVLAGVVATACLVGLLKVAGARVALPGLPGWAPWLAGGGASLLGGAAAVALGGALRYRYGWDARVVTDFSNELSTDGTLSAYAVDYLSRYPNNVPLVALMNTAHDVGGVMGSDLYGTYLWFNGACVAVVMATTFALVRTLRSTPAAFVSQGAVFVLLGLSPWVAAPYTDLPAAPLVLGGLGLAVVALGTPSMVRALLWGAAAVVVLAVAFVVKTTPATSVVALACVVAVVGWGARSTRGRAGALAVVTAGALLFTGVSSLTGAAAAERARIDMAQLDTRRTPPLPWWLANGLVTVHQDDGRTYYGSYSRDMVNASMRLRGDELQAWSERELRRRLAARSVASLVAFEVDKQVFNWGDGMFFAWGEGRDDRASVLLVTTPTARWVQDWNHVSGRHYVTRASLTNGMWLFLVLWCGLGLLATSYRRETVLLALAVVGVTAFILLFQGRSRYLLAYVPVLVVLAATVDPGARLRRAPAAAGPEP